MTLINDLTTLVQALLQVTPPTVEANAEAAEKNDNMKTKSRKMRKRKRWRWGWRWPAKLWSQKGELMISISIRANLRSNRSVNFTFRFFHWTHRAKSLLAALVSMFARKHFLTNLHSPRLRERVPMSVQSLQPAVRLAVRIQKILTS